MTYLKNKPLRYGLYGEKDFLLPDFMHCETMEYRSEKHNWVIEQHLHAHLFQIFLIESGHVTYYFEDGPQLIKTTSVVTIPENTLHGLEVSTNIKGMVLTLSSSYLESIFKSLPGVLLELGSTKVLTDLKHHKMFQLIKQMVYGLYEEFQDELPAKGMVLQNFFSLLLCGIYRLSLEKSENKITPDSRNAIYFKAFLRSMKQSYTPKKTMNEYASELHITAVHLNRICQFMVGKSSLQVVHDFLFMETKKYLKHTEYSVSEIAYRLNFEDPAYFSRFFRKLAGMSPKQFRETPGAGSRESGVESRES